MLGEVEGFAEELIQRDDGVPAGNTVIVFDWDDTLLCSTAIHSNRWCSEDVRKLECSVKKILRTAMRLGETWIVTNGNSTWVQDSAREYMPGVLPLLSRLRVVSARAAFESQYPRDPFMWKRAAFESMLNDTRQFPADVGLNLVVLGDQYPEIDAGHHVSYLRGGSTELKCVKLKEAPTVPELVGQLERLESDLHGIVAAPDDESRGIQCRHMARELGEWRVQKSSDKESIFAQRFCAISDPVAVLKLLL